MNKLYDLAVVTSKFTTRNGEEKSRWENIGAIWENATGNKFIMLKASFNPAGIARKEGSDSIVVSLFPPKQRNEKQSSREDEYVDPLESENHNVSSDASMSEKDIPF